MRFLYKVSAVSLRGGRNNNEDNFFVGRRYHPDYIAEDKRMSFETKRNGFYAVADGMGGMSQGEICALTITEFLSNHISLLKKNPDEFFYKANKKVNKACNNGGTTLSCAIVNKDNTVDVFTIGDSPVYLYKYSTKELYQVNELDNRAAELYPDECDPLIYEQSKRQLLAFLGCGRYQKDDVPYHYYRLQDVQIGDILMLCSDGIDTVSTEEIKIICECRAKNFPSLAEGLAETAVVDAAKANKCSDNTTVICIEFID